MMQIGSTHWEGELHSLWIFDGLCSMPSQHHCRIPKSSTSLLKCANFQLQVEGTAAKFPGRPSSWGSQSTSSNAEGLSKLDVTSCLKLLWQEKWCQGDPDSSTSTYPQPFWKLQHLLESVQLIRPQVELRHHMGSTVHELHQNGPQKLQPLCELECQEIPQRDLLLQKLDCAAKL